MLKVEIETSEISNLFIRFKEVIEERYWLKRVASIEDEIRGQPFLRDYLFEENTIAIWLAQCSDLVKKYGCIPLQESENHNLYPAISLATQVLSIIDHSSPMEAKKLVQRIRGAFKNPAEMRAIQFEIRVATHFVLRGHSVAWPEMEGNGTFDLLVNDLGSDGLEIECKSASEDKGRKIHRRDALEFHQLVKPKLEIFSQNLQTGISIVLTIQGRLPSLLKQRKILAKQVIDTLLSAQGMKLEDGSDIRITKFDISTLGVIKTANGVAIPSDGVDRVTATKNCESMIIGNKNGVIIFVLQSRQDNNLLKSIFDTVSESAKKQLSKTKPALFMVELAGIEAEGLLNIANQDKDPSQPPTALQISVSNFLANQSRDHVIGVGFLSGGEISSESNNVIQNRGTAYIFPKKESSLWHEDFNGLFS